MASGTMRIKYTTWYPKRGRVGLILETDDGWLAEALVNRPLAPDGVYVGPQHRGYRTSPGGKASEAREKAMRGAVVELLGVLDALGEEPTAYTQEKEGDGG